MTSVRSLVPSRRELGHLGPTLSRTMIRIVDPRYSHPSYYGRPIPPASGHADDGSQQGQQAAVDNEYLPSVPLTDRACCCTAPPAVIVLMQPAAGRAHYTDLRLCMHHYRASRDRLAALGAVVRRLDGRCSDVEGAWL
jgi:hypothetical protein